jgi:hypothetical protein
MSTQTLWPGLDGSGASIAVYAADGVTPIPPVTGAAVTLVQETPGGPYVLPFYYRSKVAAALLLTADPIGGAGSPIEVDERAYALTPEMFGAVGDGVTDDSAPIQAALNLIRDMGGGTLALSRTYSAKDLIVYSNTEIVGGGHDTGIAQIFSASTHHYALSVNPGSGGTTNTADNQRHVTFRNFALSATGGFDATETHHLLNLNACSDVLVEGLLFSAFRADGLYLGSSNVAATERHNLRVTVRKCIFDGVNNENRNGLSVIDCTGLLVEDCWFRNCTSATEPAPLDIEPDANAWARILDITIRKNRFSNCRGTTGLIGMSLPVAQSGLTTPMRGLTVEDNTFDPDCTASTCLYLWQAGAASTSTVSNEITVTNNRANGLACRVFTLSGVRGVRFDANDWSDMLELGIVGYDTFAAAARRCVDVHFGARERYTRCDTTGLGGMNVFDVSYMVVDALFDSCYQAIQFNGTGTSSDNVDTRRLRLRNALATGIAKTPGHALSASTNRKRGMSLGGMADELAATAPGEALSATLVVDAPSIASGAAYQSAAITVTGAAFGDAVAAGCSIDIAGLQLTARITAADTVKFTLSNSTGGAVDLGSATYTISVTKAGP